MVVAMRRAQHILERRRATVGVTELKRRLDSSLPSSVGSREIDDSMAMTIGADQPSSSSTTPTVPSPTSLPAPRTSSSTSHFRRTPTLEQSRWQQCEIVRRRLALHRGWDRGGSPQKPWRPFRRWRSNTPSWIVIRLGLSQPPSTS